MRTPEAFDDAERIESEGEIDGGVRAGQGSTRESDDEEARPRR